MVVMVVSLMAVRVFLRVRMLMVLVMMMGVLVVVLRPLNCVFNWMRLMSGLGLLQLLGLVFVVVEVGGVVVVDVGKILLEDFKPPQVLVPLCLTIPALRAVLVEDAV